MDLSERINSLPFNEKVYMMLNPKSFPLEYASCVRFNTPSWNNLIDKGCEYKQMYSDELSKKKSITDSIQSIKSQRFIKFANDIMNDKPSSTKEDVLALCKTMEFILSELYNSEEIINKLLTASIFVNMILPYKLDAHHIFSGIENRGSMTKYSSIIKDTFKSLSDNVDNKENAMVCINLLHKVLGVNNADNVNKFDPLYSLPIVIYSLLSNTAIEDVEKDVLKVKDSVIDYLRNIGNNEIDTKMTDVTDSKSTVLPGKKNSINLTPSMEMFLRDMSPENLSTYVGDYKDLSFKLPESSLGCILSKSEYDIGKVMLNDGRSFSILNDGETTYLLFHTPELPNKIYGLQCDKIDKNNDEYKLLTIVLPENTEYKLY